MLTFLIYLVLAFGLAVVASVVAAKKRRSSFAWFALLVIAAIPRIEPFPAPAAAPPENRSQ